MHNGRWLDLVAPSKLLSILSTIRGCVIPRLYFTLRYSGIRNDGTNVKMNRPSWGSCAREIHHLMEIHTQILPAKTPPSEPLNLLRTLPLHIAEGLGRSENAQDVFPTLSAITTVIECYAISFACDEAAAAWQGVATWFANVTDHFNQMVRRHRPAALVVLVHWAAILVKRAEHVICWFSKGSVRIMVLQVTRQFSANGHAVFGLVECVMGIVKD